MADSEESGKSGNGTRLPESTMTSGETSTVTPRSDNVATVSASISAETAAESAMTSAMEATKSSDAATPAGARNAYADQPTTRRRTPAVSSIGSARNAGFAVRRATAREYQNA
jgi:antitoxin (DNA-binding transcriptional repressor) of toxin-antitoxin stability system